VNDGDAAWLAAAIDGEGTVTLHRRKTNHKYTPSIIFTNNNRQLHQLPP
jgi:hypothetical protein